MWCSLLPESNLVANVMLLYVARLVIFDCEKTCNIPDTYAMLLVLGDY